MNKLWFKLLIVLMSISLLGIIAIQVYWFKVSFDNNEEQFMFHVKQVLGNVANKLQEKERYTFYNRYNQAKSKGAIPKTSDLLEFGYYQRNARTKETIIYSNSIMDEDYDIFATFFEKNADKARLKSYVAKRKSEVYKEGSEGLTNSELSMPSISIEKQGEMKILNDAMFEISYKDIASLLPINDRVNKEEVKQLLQNELNEYGVNTPFEFNVYSNGLATKIKSENFSYDKLKKDNTYSIPIFSDNEDKTNYQLLVSFPQKKKFLFKDVVAITILSILFTLIIILTYANTLSQLFRQRQISEIKTDFINNMTHEFKTPIATINLALDAIKSPKVIDDKEKVFRYLQMIRDENKRMHAQVENVLRISKLEKKELEIEKEEQDIHDILEDAIEHVYLIIEDRNGKVNKHFDATASQVLLNDVHFTNVLVNILDNAIKYSPNNPVIDIYTENTNNAIIIKIKDQGQGMSKQAQKQVFEKFYREHTGDVHNVKGHGLGLAYVKRIVEDHNGEVYVESEKGKGSTFIIKLPLTK